MRRGEVTEEAAEYRPRHLDPYVLCNVEAPKIVQNHHPVMLRFRAIDGAIQRVECHPADVPGWWSSRP